MNLLYCGDDGIKDGVLISVLSLLKNTTEPLEIYILTINLTRDRAAKIGIPNLPPVKPFSGRSAAFLDKIVKEKNPKNFVRLIDATDVFINNLPIKNMGSYFTPCSMLRLYIDKIPELRKLDRILYLDYDVVCRRDIAEFYHMDMEGIEAAGVLDIYGRRFYHYHGLFKQDYMNSGVMLFNIPECLKTKMFERAVKLCAKKWMLLADQAALNKSITKRKLMPLKYNDQNERPNRETVLHHFSNNFKFWPYFRLQKIKPFEIDKVHNILRIHSYDDIFEEYKRMKEYL